MAEYFVAENDFLMPKRHTQDAAGFDFRIKVPGGSAEIKPHQLARFDTGVTLAKTFPPSRCVLLTHRSSSFGMGLLIHAVIDADFPLEIVVCARNVSDLPVRVYNGDRLAQGLVVRCERETASSPKPERRGGSGSTGN